MNAFHKSIDDPDEVKQMPSGNGRANVVSIGGLTFLRGTLDPGWRWSNDLKPVMGGTSCQLPHTGVMLEGTFHIEMDDGTSVDLQPGDVYNIPAGHDAWVVGDTPVVSYDFVLCGAPDSIGAIADKL
jgi:hypothetical protein